MIPSCGGGGAHCTTTIIPPLFPSARGLFAFRKSAFSITGPLKKFGLSCLEHYTETRKLPCISMTSLQTCTYKMPQSIFSEVSPAATVASPLRPAARQLFDVLEEGGGRVFWKRRREGGKGAVVPKANSSLHSPVLDRQRRRPHRNGRRRDPLQHTREKVGGIRSENF